MRVAILDDYQQVALASADWSAVRELADIYVFAQHIARTDALVSALEPFDTPSRMLGPGQGSRYVCEYGDPCP